MISIVSSAYCTIGKSSSGWGIGAISRLEDAALLTSTCSNSAAITKSNGESGFPCRTPLLHLKNFPGTPFRSSADEPEPSMLMIQSTHLLGKPRCIIICIMAWCATVSKAFSKSNLRMMTSLLDWWHWWIYSKLQAKQSCIVLDLMKPYWFLWIRAIMIFWRRLLEFWSTASDWCSSERLDYSHW